MKKRTFFSLFIVGCLALVAILTAAAGAGEQLPAGNEINVPGLKAGKKEIRSGGHIKPSFDFGSFPLYFVPNKGQVDPESLFYAGASRYTLWLTKEGFVFDSIKRGNHKSQIPVHKQITSPRRGRPVSRFGAKETSVGESKIRSVKQITSENNERKGENPAAPSYVVGRDVSRLMFIGANKNPGITAAAKTGLKVNYFKGNDKSKWHCDIPTSKAVLYSNLYQRIDLKVYGIEKQVEYDWIVKPGGNPAEIKFKYKNIKSSHIDPKGDLIVKTQFGELIHKKPAAFQEMKGQRREGKKAGKQKYTTGQKEKVAVEFKKIGRDTYGFTVGDYDKSRELIIDPVVLAYSTYLGGASEDGGYSIAVDDSGSVYVTGETSSANFPKLNQYQNYQSDPDPDAFVTRIDTTQSGAASLVYSTYLGGNGNDYGEGIAVDGSGNAYITGWTNSTNFPTLNQYQGDPGDNSYDAFVTKIDTNSSGASSLVYSTYLGGGDSDIGSGIAADASGTAYVAGYTDSTDFPTLNQYQANQSATDAFVAKIDTTQSGTSSLLYSTYLGGSNNEYGFAVAIDGSGDAYVTGYTLSSDFPTLSQYQTDQTDSDAFVTRIDTTLAGAAGLIYSTYLGGSNEDWGHDVAVDDSGKACVTGYTQSTDFPTLNQYQTDQTSDDVFMTRIDTTQSGAASLLYSTYLGGSGSDVAFGIALDNSGYTYITGYTTSTDFPTLDQYQADPGDGYRDVFVTSIDPAQSGTASLIYSTYLGGSNSDSGYAVAVDNCGAAYVTGSTYSGDFPIKNQYQSNLAAIDGFVSKLTYPTITVTAPNGGESLEIGSTSYITWDTCVSGDVKITLWKDDVLVGNIAGSVSPTPGSYAWVVGSYDGGSAAAGTGYAIKIRERGTTVVDASDTAFSISEIRVTAPNGGEDWFFGAAENITWDSTGVTGDVKITLWKDGVLLGKINSGIAASAGTYAWTVGQYDGGSAPAGSGYTVKIMEKGAAVADFSDTGFTISKIRVTSPNGGEDWLSGSNQDIAWTASGIPGDVKITLWKDGALVGKINSSIAASAGAYAWAVGQHDGGSAPAGSGYAVKIVEKGGAAADLSDTGFTISPLLNVTSPNGGENWQIGAGQNITWNASGLSENVKITLWKDGVLVGTIVSSTPPGPGSYSWTVGQHSGGTAAAGTGYTIKIRERGTAVVDVSDASFTLAN